jgi:hypothetical protein
VPKEAISKEAISKEAISKEAISKEAISKEAISKEAIPRKQFSTPPPLSAPSPLQKKRYMYRTRVLVANLFTPTVLLLPEVRGNR